MTSYNKIMVTGGNGFLGKHLCAKLHERGHENIIVPDISEYDLTNQNQTERLFEATKPNLVFHLAGSIGGIGANLAHPGKFFYDNMSMGLNVLEQARRVGVSKVVTVGTVCAYPKYTPVPFKEESLWDGYPEETNAPYGIAKRALLVMCQAYRQEYGSNFVFVLPVNLYGPGDNFDPESSHVIPAMIRKFIEAKIKEDPSVTLWGSGVHTREFLYVEDAADALVLTAEKYDSLEPMNLGAGFEISIRELANKIRQTVGYYGRIEWDRSKPNGQPRRTLDTSRAKEQISFAAKISLDEGLERTIQWYLKNK